MNEIPREFLPEIEESSDATLQTIRKKVIDSRDPLLEKILFEMETKIFIPYKVKIKIHDINVSYEIMEE